MSSYNLRQEQRNFIKYLTDQGILDDHFEHILDLRQGESHQFLIDLINMFCSDAESCITQVNKYMNEHIIDYAKVITFVHQIRGSSSSIGGRRMALACRDLRYACDDMDHARCLEYFNMVKEEYQILKDKFNIISQMEININTHEGKKCEP
ncbi:hypothetical protein K2173_013920 [Erythroxylum novogranatense]|uniref:Histidine-containing phosphotransfer protein n=1 Tax=Erythroxylum novogranatense TaxID=1862640 RepID=A0AAV8SD93_9ROSI|nr:hypothetical protein K2173_013920 [Erythroxylum novogranatense]